MQHLGQVYLEAFSSQTTHSRLIEASYALLPTPPGSDIDTDGDPAKGEPLFRSAADVDEVWLIEGARRIIPRNSLEFNI